MNKADIAGRLAGSTGLGKAQAAGAVEAVFAAIGEALAEVEDVRVAGFGTFAVKNRPARAGRNPRTGEAVSIPTSTVLSFKAAKALRGRRPAGSGPAAITAGSRWRRSRRRATLRTSIPTSRRPTAALWRCGRTVPPARRWCG